MTKMFYVHLIQSNLSYYVLVRDVAATPSGLTIKGTQKLRTITPQAAARRFIRKRLKVLLVLEDDGANEPADALGGQKSGQQYVKVGDAKRYANQMKRMTVSGANTGGTYGVKVVYDLTPVKHKPKQRQRVGYTSRGRRS
jgi:hypothetical protein